MKHLSPTTIGQTVKCTCTLIDIQEKGVKVVGATVPFVDEGTDTGPIILQKAVNVEQGDTPSVLQRRVMEQAEWI